MKKKIVITGMGVVTPIGNNVEAFRESLNSRVCGISNIEKIDTADLQIHRAGEVKNFNVKEFMPTKLAMDLEPFMQYAYVAALEAVRDSGIETHSDRLGIVMGSALSGIAQIGETEKQYIEKGRTAGPKFLLKAMGNSASAQFAIQHGITGPGLTVSTACSTGGDAILIARMLIESGMADAMLVMAGEACVCPSLIQSLTRLGALSKTGESLPFNTERNGFVLGEGGGAIVIETEESALARGARVYAELSGCANNNDAFNPVQPNPEGTGAAKCMSLAIEDAGIDPSDIGYINAHGTATHAGDLAECAAIRRVFGENTPLVSSTKSATGHMMGAGGVTEVIACVLAINDHRLPVTLNLTSIDPECNVALVTEANCETEVRYAMSNAMGFGGQNSCVIVGRYNA